MILSRGGLTGLIIRLSGAPSPARRRYLQGGYSQQANSLSAPLDCPILPLNRSFWNCLSAPLNDLNSPIILMKCFPNAPRANDARAKRLVGTSPENFYAPGNCYEKPTERRDCLEIVSVRLKIAAA